MSINSARSIELGIVWCLATFTGLAGGCCGENTGEAVSAVGATMTDAAPSGLSFTEGPLKGGTAVLAGNAAYWIKDGTVYAANGFAKTWSRSLEYSPIGIDYSSVKNAVSGG